MSNQIKDAFDAVHIEEGLKERTRSFLHYRLCERRKRRSRLMRYGVALCSLTLLLGVGGHSLYFTPVSYISIDINPSLEFELNRLDRVISVTPYNDDGSEAVENLPLKNLKYDDAIITLLGSEEMSAYLSEDSRISISVVSSYDQKNTEIQERVMECTGSRYGAVSCHSGSGDDVRNAHHAGLSFGKYRYYQELQSLDPSVTAEDVKVMSMRQIQDLIAQYSDGASGSGCEKQDGSCGHNRGEGGRHRH